MARNYASLGQWLGIAPPGVRHQLSHFSIRKCKQIGKFRALWSVSLKFLMNLSVNTIYYLGHRRNHHWHMLAPTDRPRKNAHHSWICNYSVVDRYDWYPHKTIVSHMYSHLEKSVELQQSFWHNYVNLKNSTYRYHAPWCTRFIWDSHKLIHGRNGGP